MRRLALTVLITFLVCFIVADAQGPGVSNPPLIIQQSGTPQGAVVIMNCSTNVTCSVGSGTVTVTASGGGAAPAVSLKTANYTATSTDFSNGQHFAFNCASTGYQTASCTVTLPSTAPSTGTIYVQNISPVTLLISPNGLTLDGGAWNHPVPQGTGVKIGTDGTNYETVGVDSAGDNFALRRTVRGSPCDTCSGGNQYIWDYNASSSANNTCATTNELAPTTTAPIALQCTTSATSGNSGFALFGQGDNSSGNTTHPNIEDFQMWIHLPSATVTSQRIWVGFVGSNSVPRATQAGTDTLSNGSAPSGGSALRLSTSASDATWQCVTSDGSATNNVVSTGLTLDTNWHLLRIVNDDSVSPVKTYFYFDGALVCGSPISTHTLPANNQAYVGMMNTTLTTATKEFDVGPATLTTF